jgi:hypothetical protein
MPNNLTIANIFLFCAILCMALSAMVHSPFYFIYSFGTVVLAGAVRHSQLPHKR